MQESSGWPRHLKQCGLTALIFGLVLACYWPALRGGILWDDPAHVTRPELQSWAGLVRIWTDIRATQQYYPVLFSAFWLEHRLWGDHTLGYHLMNVFLHALSCCLLAVLIRRLASLPEPPVGAASVPPRAVLPAGAEWFAAAIFAVHPVCVESVAWITEQKNTLSLTFFLLAALAYLDFAVHRRGRTYVLATGLFLLALGSKTVTVILPAALLVVLWWRYGKLSWRRDVLPLVPWFLVSGVMGWFVAWIERTVIGAQGAAFTLTAVERVLLAGRVFWFYLGKMLWPADLIFYYPRWDVPAEASGWIGWVLAGVVLYAVLWAVRRRTRGPLAGGLLYLGALFPFLGFFNAFYFNFSYVADHSQYLAGCSLVAALTMGVATALAGASSALRVVVGSAGAVLILLFAGLARQQSALYVDNETLARGTIARNPSAWMAHQILATTLAKTTDQHEEAIAEFREVMRLKPDYPDACFGLGVELARLPGGKAEAMAAYRRTIEISPYHPMAHNNLALELARQPGHNVDEVIAHFETALRGMPEYALAHGNLAETLIKIPGRLPEAMAHYTEALRINPNLAWAHCRLAFQLMQMPGRQAEAFQHYAEALRIDPNYIDAHNALAVAYAMTGRLGEARREWETVLRIDPRQDAARRNLRRLDDQEGR